MLIRAARLIRDLCGNASSRERALERIWLQLGSQLSDDIRVKYGTICMPWSIRNLARYSFKPATVLDIGAYAGEWTAMAKPYFPDSRFLMVEAQPDKKEKLQTQAATYNGTVDVEICLLGREERAAVPFCLMETGSSIFPERTSQSRTLAELPMRRLDDVVQQHGLAGRFFLKLDVQGAELEVLGGAQKTLSETDVVLMETAFLPYNEGAPDVSEVVCFMRSRDFLPYDICSILRRASDMAAFQVDLLFVRNGHPLRSDRAFW